MADPVPTNTPEQQRLLDAAIAARAAKNADKDTPPQSISTPANQEWILARTKEGDTPDPNAPQVPTPAGYSWYRNIGYTPPKASAAQLYGGKETGYYITVPVTPENPNGVRQVIPANLPNADEEIDKYLTREQNEQLRAQRQRNEIAGFGYADDDTVVKRSMEMQKVGVDQEQVKARYAELAQKAKEFDRTQKVADDKAAQEILQSQATVGQIGATTQQIGANTAQINQNIDIAGQKLPYDLAQAAATTAGTQMSTALTQQQIDKYKQDLAQGRAPTVQAPPTGMSQWARDPNTGAITQGAMNPEYLPKTQAEVAARAGQIQSLANAKKAEVMAKVGENFTPDQAYAEFNNWYDQQVGPQLETLKAAQQAAQIEQQKAQQAMRTSAMTTAQAGGQQALSAYQQLRESHPMSDKTQDVFAQIGRGKSLKDIDLQGAFTWEGPNPIDLAQQQTQNALKYIDPQSAQANGLPPPDFSGLDIEAMLGRQRYMPGGGAPPPPPVPAPVMAAAATAAPAGARFKPGWAGSDPRLSGAYDPTLYVPGG